MKGTKQLFASARTKDSVTSGSTDNWGTPQPLYDLLNKQFNFQLDPCATPDLAKCERFITPEQDGLKTSWEGLTAFVNFPYSQAKAWSNKCIEEAKSGSTVVILCAARTDTGWWQSLASWSSEVQFIKGRLSFSRQDGDTRAAQGATFPSSVIVLRGNLQQIYFRSSLWDLSSSIRRGK